MSWLFGRSNIRSNPYSKYDSAPCMNKYDKIKNDIEQQIDAFDKIRGNNIRTEWDRINKYITNADKDLKECYKKQYVKVKLKDEEKIKNFKNICNRDRTCNNQATPATKPPITKAPTQRTCNKGKECKNEASVTDSVKSQSKLSSGAANTQSSERNVSQEQGQNKAVGQKSMQESVVSQSQTSIMPSESSVGTHDKASQKIVNRQSAISGVVETQERQYNASAPFGTSEPGSTPSDPSSQCIPGETSGLTCTSRGKNLGTIGIQTNPNCGKTLGTNKPEIQDSAGKFVAGQTRDAQDVSKGIFDVLPLTNRNSISGRHSDEDSLQTSTSGVGNDAEASGSVNSDSSEVSNAALGDVLSRDVDTNSITSVDTHPYDRTFGSESNSVPSVRGVTNGIEIKNGQELGSEHLCEGTSCSAEQVGELSDGSLDIYGKVMNAIKNNPQIIKTSAPIGIALLLGLLFKYTPLWRVLTKKNMKKGAVINEELNSVLQEPSIMDDERSIPFSYGAFEYSTFDQNVY
ncbi:VIR protein [Plasmodium vivax]|uniref:VIR protein n=1 Tax=Plasmodium vivax TaxID=5855 RepID=A0A1G4E262_PLAVI|nr:VIR protein [Plasmodium vivax]